MLPETDAVLEVVRETGGDGTIATHANPSQQRPVGHQHPALNPAAQSLGPEISSRGERTVEVGSFAPRGAAVVLERGRTERSTTEDGGDGRADDADKSMARRVAAALPYPTKNVRPCARQRQTYVTVCVSSHNGIKGVLVLLLLLLSQPNGTHDSLT